MPMDLESFLEHRPYEVYVSKPHEDGIRYLTRMDDEGIRNLLINDTTLGEGERETFVEALAMDRARVAVTEKCRYDGYILVVINKGDR